MNNTLTHNLILLLAGGSIALISIFIQNRLAKNEKQFESRPITMAKNKRKRERFPQKQVIQCTFERVILVKKIPYWIYWFTVGVIVFVLGEIFARSINDELFFRDRVIFSLGIATVPTIHIWLCYSFEETMSELFGSIWKRNTGFDNWLDNSKKNIFTLHLHLGKITTGAIVIFGLITVFTLGIPFGEPFYNALGLLTFTPFLFICGQSLYIAIALLSHLARIVRMPVKVPFYLMPTTSLFKLRNYYLTLGLSILLFYVALVFAVWQSPYGFHPILLFWLSILALYPLGILFTSSFQIHVLMCNIKNAHIKKINDEIQQTLKISIGNNRGNFLVRLEKLMDIQDKIQKMKEWL